MTNFIMFDVGANWGTDSLKRAELDVGSEIWAFEPVPNMANYLRTNSKNFTSRYHVHEIALCDFDGESEFNVQELSDWGCSSLNTFKENLSETWPGRKEFKFTKTINVQVMRFDTWFKTHQPDIDRIDYFHCDTQGSDLKTLMGMGEYLPLIRNGIIECSSDDQNKKLYKEGHTLSESIQFLEKNNFYITNVVSNDRTNNEYNIFFKRVV